MGTKAVQLDEEVYECGRISATTRLLRAIGRLIGGPSQLELAGILSDEEAAEMWSVIERIDVEGRKTLSGIETGHTIWRKNEDRTKNWRKNRAMHFERL